MTKPLPPSPPNPWVTKSTKTVYENPWMKVEANPVELPDGSDGIYGVVRFKNRAVGIIPYEDGYIWMVGQTRYALDQYSWEIPEGGVPEGEDMAQAARRELKEETGLTAEKLTHLFDLHTSNSITDEWGQIYLATGLREGETEPEASEDITQLKLTIEDAITHIEAGRITDCMTIAAVYKLRLLQLSGELD